MIRYIVYLVMFLLIPSFIGWGQEQEKIEMYARIHNIQGEATAHGFEEWISCTGFNLGITQPRTSGGSSASGAARASTDFLITKGVDKASAELQLACARGTQIPDLIFACVKNARDGRPITFYKFTLRDVRVTSVREKSGGQVPTEEVSFSYRMIKWEYTPVSSDGHPGSPVSGEWDFKSATAH